MIVTSAELDSPGLRFTSAKGRWVLFATILGSGIAFLDGSVVNVALPSIGRDFHVGLADLQWTVTAYTLTLSAFLLLGGSLGDRYGRRRVFVFGLVWFTVASMVCGAAPNALVLVIARAVQGVGSALLTPASLAIIEATFRPQDRSPAIGAWAGFGGLFGAIGPLVGGLLVGALTWRLVFFINLPLAALAVWVALRHIPETRHAGVRGNLDVVGPLLAALGLGGITFGLIEGSAAGWASPGIVSSLAVGVVLLVLFFVYEQRYPNPMLPLNFFRSRQFSGANGATFVIYAALGAVTFLLVIYLQQVLHYSPLGAGASLLPLTALLLTLSSTTGRLASRIGPRLPMTLGPLMAAVGMAMFIRVTPGSSYVAAVLPAAIVFGLGLVLTVPALTSTALGAVSSNSAGIASAINNDVARVGALVAIALIPVLAGINTGGNAVDVAALSSGFRNGMLICAGLCALGGLVSFLTISNRWTPPTVQPAPLPTVLSRAPLPIPDGDRS
jgi:EmrB/QacA subfamily drug resistance transporter